MVVQSLPGMPPIQHVVMPGVSVHISNVVGPTPAYAPVPVSAPMVARTPEAEVQRRVPARVPGYTIGFGFLALMAGLWLLLPLGVPFFAVLLAQIPCVLVATFAFVVGRRAGEGLSSHQFEQAIFRVASEHEGIVKVVSLAQSTGRPLRECQLAIDAMVASGHATVDSDERGALFYRIPDLEPPRISERARELG
jgi:hypothetical protein